MFGIAWIKAYLAGLQTLETDETPRPEPEEPQEVEPAEPPGISHVGAWCGMSSLRNPSRDVAFAKSIGLNRLDVIVNEHSSDRNPRGFDTYDRQKIVEFCHRAQGEGIQTHLMSWIMPYEDYIQEASEQLTSLCSVAGTSSLQWDAEEPWTLAKRRIPYREAAQMIKEKFADLTCRMGVNGIGYTPVGRFGPLAEICDYVVPQCYSTSTSGQKPEDVVPKFVRRYKELFGDKVRTIGLAAYRQKIPNYTVDQAMRAPIHAAHALEGVNAIVYWSLTSIRRNRRVANVIKSIRSLDVG